MTVDSKLSKVVYQGNGITTEFPFYFNVFKRDWLTVTISDIQGQSQIVSVPEENITISESGGMVNFYYYPNPVANPTTKIPLPSGFSLSITRNMSFLQMIALENGGVFLAKVIENSFDIATAERQQLLEMLSRSVILPPTSEESPLDMLNRIFEAEKNAFESAHHSNIFARGTDEEIISIGATGRSSKGYVENSQVFADGLAEQVIALGSDYSSKDWAIAAIGINTQGSSKYYAKESALSAQDSKTSKLTSEEFSKLSEIQANKSHVQAELAKNSAIASQNSTEASAFSAMASAKSACESMENVNISDLSAQSAQSSAVASAQSATNSVVSATASAASASNSSESANAAALSSTASEQSAVESQRSVILSEENSCESLENANASDLSAQSAEASAVASAQSATNSAITATASATSARESLASADASEQSAQTSGNWAIADITENTEGSAKHWAIADITENIKGSAKYWATQAGQAVPDATEEIMGKAAFATAAEVLAGTVINKIVSPQGFYGGVSAHNTDPIAHGNIGFPSGTRIVFQQSAAPTGWEKEMGAAYNNVALRMTTGNVTTGGTQTFTQAFKAQTLNMSVSGSVGSQTLSTSQMPSHKHIGGMYTLADSQYNAYGYTTGKSGRQVGVGGTNNNYLPYTSTVGSGSSHRHSLSGASGSANLNLAVKYVDFIIATKT